MKGRPRTIVIVAAAAAIAALGSGAPRVVAQCGGGPSYYYYYYDPGPCVSPVFAYRVWAPPAGYCAGCAGPVYIRPYPVPPASQQPAPGGWGTAPGGGPGQASRSAQPRGPDAVPAPPAGTHQADPGPSPSHRHAEPQAPVAAEAPAVAPSPPRPTAPIDLEALAQRQKVCPVTGARLGSMGPPVRVHAQGRDVLLCCRGCVDRFQRDPDKYLATLDQEGRSSPGSGTNLRGRP